jgi:hypothetical protein
MSTAAGGELQIFKDFHPPVAGSSAFGHCAEIADRVLTRADFARGVVRAGIRPAPPRNVLGALWRSFPRLKHDVLTTSMIVASLKRTREEHQARHDQRARLGRRDARQAPPRAAARPTPASSTRAALRIKGLRKRLHRACFGPPPKRGSRGRYIGLAGLRAFFFPGANCQIALDGEADPGGSVLSEEDFVRALGRAPQSAGPRGESPRGESPRGESSRGESPRGESPRGESPRDGAVDPREADNPDVVVATPSEARKLHRSFLEVVRRTTATRQEHGRGEKRQGIDETLPPLELLDTDVLASLEREFGVPLKHAKAAVRRYRRAKDSQPKAAAAPPRTPQEGFWDGGKRDDVTDLLMMPADEAAARAEEMRRKNALLVYRLGQTN